MTITYRAYDFDTASERRGRAVVIDGKPRFVSEADADRLAAAGVEFAYLD